MVALTLVFSAYPVVKWVKAQNYMLGRPKRQWVCAVMLLVALPAIFFVPLKNIALHGNPVYPMKVTVFGTVLNYAEDLPPPNLGAGSLIDRTRAVKWIYSTFEIGMGSIFNVQ